MIKHIRKNSIIVKFVVILLALLLVPVFILMVLSTNNINQIETESANQFLSSNLRVVSTTMDGILSNLEYNHTGLILNTEFIHTLKNLKRYKDRDLYTDYLQTKIIKNQLMATAVSSNYIYSIYTYSYNAERIFTSKVNWNSSYNSYNADTSPWIQAHDENIAGHPWVVTTGVEDGRQILSSTRKVAELDLPTYGIVSINIDASMVSNLLNGMNLNEETYCFVMDANGTFIDSNNAQNDTVYQQIIAEMPQGNPNGLYEFYLNDLRYFAFYMISDYSNFTYVIAAPSTSIETVTPVIRNLNIIIMLIITLIVLLFFCAAYLYLYRPIRSLFDHMHKVEEGDFNTRLPESPSYEIGYIHANFNNMVSNIQKLINDNYLTQLLRNETELKALQSKLNEHFLYNTLDTIHWKARLEEAPETCKMIFLLSNFYRLSLSSGREFIEIKHVIDLIRSYLQIQKIRMGEMLEYKIDCAEELMRLSVLKYLFQPLVENAIIHGSQDLDRVEILHINFEKRGEFIRFTIEDNGHGIEKEKLKQILDFIYTAEDYEGNHFALKTLHTQLKLHYGNDSKLYIESSYQSGCRIWFDLPVDRLEDGAHVNNDDH